MGLTNNGLAAIEKNSLNDQFVSLMERVTSFDCSKSFDNLKYLIAVQVCPILTTTWALVDLL